jgi:hypothetical protein
MPAAGAARRRTELQLFYTRRGYAECGTEPFEHPSLTAPCHFVVLRKRVSGRRQAG